jgi:hypothetical protein
LGEALTTPYLKNVFYYEIFRQKASNLDWIYRTIILPIVLYGCKTWSLTLREELRLRLCENRVLRRQFGPKRDEVTGEWRKLHNDELNDLYSLNLFPLIKSRRMKFAGHVACVEENIGVYRVLVRKTEGKRPLGKSRRRWEDNITMDLKEVEFWIND